MSRVTESLPAKIIAIFLYAITVLLGTLSLFAIIVLYQYGFYSMESIPYDEISQPLLASLCRMRYGLIALFTLCLLLFLACLIFLLSAAGHRRGAAQVQANHQDKIPLDLYVVGDGLLIALTLFLATGDVFYYGATLGYFLSFILGILSTFLLLLAFLMTFATRLKLGKWWHNSLIWRLGMLLIRFCRSLPFMWKSALAALAFVILNISLASTMPFSGTALFFYLLLNGGLIAIVCLAALQLRKLKKAGEALAAGDFDYKTETRGLFWDFKRHAENLNSVACGMSIAVEQRMKSERMKTELITNVSHDIKTPLTSILNYIDLLEKQKLDSTSENYVQILARQAKRLKKLTEDLVEASKASTGNLKVEIAPTDLRELIHQTAAEYEERLAAAQLTPVITLPEEGCYALADGRLLWRVLDNLLSNACKYAQPGTRLYIDAMRQEDRIQISMKNVSQQQLNISADELMERFVRGDSARSTEGSGLGLNIARSLIELQHGSLRLCIDGDLFKALVELPAL